jgi:F-type H+-transporting ATPase subunit b
VGTRTTLPVRLLAGVGLAAVILLSTAGVASAQQQKKEKKTEQSKCVEDASKSGKQASECYKAPNPILPKANELVWGTISFVILFAFLAKKGYPSVKKGMDNRAEKIRKSLDDADKAKDEAHSILDQYQRQLADAKSESARIIEEARQAADKLRQDLKRQAEQEVDDIKERAQQDIAAQVERAKSDLQARVAELSIELAEKVVERELDRDTNLALIESFIRETQGTSP